MQAVKVLRLLYRNQDEAGRTHNWILLFDVEHTAQAMMTLVRWASTPGVPFNWYDAAIVTRRIHARLKAARAVAGRI